MNSMKIVQKTRLEELTGYTPEEAVGWAVAVVTGVCVAAVLSYQAGRTDQAVKEEGFLSTCDVGLLSSPRYPSGHRTLMCEVPADWKERQDAQSN